MKKQIADILHTIFCRGQHEYDMSKMSTTDKCTFYLEMSIEPTWRMAAHEEWLDFAETFLKACTDIDPVDAIREIVSIYKSMKVLEGHPVLIRCSKLLMEGELDENGKIEKEN